VCAFLLELIAVAITPGPSYSYDELSKSTPLCKVHPRDTQDIPWLIVDHDTHLHGGSA
jgi:hypothetical protein